MSVALLDQLRQIDGRTSISKHVPPAKNEFGSMMAVFIWLAEGKKGAAEMVRVCIKALLILFICLFG